MRFYPQHHDGILTNPGMGFTCAPPAFEENPPLTDNRGRPVAPYRFSQYQKTWNHPDGATCFHGLRWRHVEPEAGVYDFSGVDKRLQDASERGVTVALRLAPYGFLAHDDIPAWLRAQYPEKPAFPFWQIDPNTTDYPERWARMIAQFAARYDGHPLVECVDMALCGAWGEGGGTEFMAPGAVDTIVSAYINGFRTTPLVSLLHDPESLKIIRSYDRPVGFRVDCLGDMGGFHGDSWSHMTDFYPQNIENFGMRDAWKTAPVFFEACWHMTDWHAMGWDVDHIVDQANAWHGSLFNAKGTPIPEATLPAVTQWLTQMGYRFQVPAVDIAEGEIALTLVNVGVAPRYHAAKPVLRLESANGMIELASDFDARGLLPGQPQKIVFALPSLASGSYTVKLAFPHPVRKSLELPLEERDADGFYPLAQWEVAP